MDLSPCSRPPVLIIDDDLGVCETFPFMLGSLGYATVAAQTGTGGLDLAKRAAALSFVLCDVCLPDIDGLDLFHELRIVQPRVAIILMSGFATVRGVVAALRAGVGDYLEKPVSLEDLSRVIAGGSMNRTTDDSSGLGASRSVESPADSRVTRVLRRLQDNPVSTDLELSAQQCSVSVSHFRRLFRQQVGQPFEHARADMVLARAATLLGSTTQRVSDIAFSLGFDSLSAFDRAFRRRYGTSPRSYRRTESSRVCADDP